MRVWNILYKIIREWNLYWSIALSSAKQADKNLKYLPDKSQTYKSLMSCRYCQCEESSRKLLWCAVWCKCFCLINFFKACIVMSTVGCCSQKLIKTPNRSIKWFIVIALKIYMRVILFCPESTNCGEGIKRCQSWHTDAEYPSDNDSVFSDQLCTISRTKIVVIIIILLSPSNYTVW